MLELDRLSKIKKEINDLQNISLSQIDYGYIPPDNETTYHAHELLDILPLPNYVSFDATGSICFDYEFEDFEITGYESHPHIKAPVAI